MNSLKKGYLFQKQQFLKVNLYLPYRYFITTLILKRSKLNWFA